MTNQLTPTQAKRAEFRASIIEVLMDASTPLTTQEIANRLDCNYPTAYSNLRAMAPNQQWGVKSLADPTCPIIWHRWTPGDPHVSWEVNPTWAAYNYGEPTQEDEDAAVQAIMRSIMAVG